MKRSEINAIMQSADEFLRAQSFHLPPFAYWSVTDWLKQGPEAREIAENQLGWDITDFGSGNFQRCGLFLFTLRNGLAEALMSGRGKLYAEKIMLVGVDQLTPLHFHWTKTEDIINRGGGRLRIQLYRSTPEQDLATGDVHIQMDGVTRRVPAGGVITLAPGESVTLPDHLYHKFWGEGERVLVGEVSLVNDDKSDNRFYEEAGRFPDIVEDEIPLHLLVGDYARYYKTNTRQVVADVG